MNKINSYLINSDVVFVEVALAVVEGVHSVINPVLAYFCSTLPS